MMEIREFADALQYCAGVVYDLDKTLVDGRVAQGVGKQFLVKELFRGHLNHVLLGARNYGEVLKRAENEGEVAGLKYFMGVIGQTGCMTTGMFYKWAEEYMDKHVLPGAKEFVYYLRHPLRKPSFISTLGTDISAGAANGVFGFCMESHQVANPVKRGRNLRNGGVLIAGLEPVMRTGADKLRGTERMLHSYYSHQGLSLDKCLVVGDDRNDHEMMRAARLSAASPLADQDTINLASIPIEDYRQFLEELRAV